VTDPAHLFHPLFSDGLDHGSPGRGVAVRDGDVSFIGRQAFPQAVGEQGEHAQPRRCQEYREGLPENPGVIPGIVGRSEVREAIQESSEQLEGGITLSALGEMRDQRACLFGQQPLIRKVHPGDRPGNELLSDGGRHLASRIEAVRVDMHVVAGRDIEDDFADLLWRKTRNLHQVLGRRPGWEMRGLGVGVKQGSGWMPEIAGIAQRDQPFSRLELPDATEKVAKRDVVLRD
jgi:hypothetical protein